MKFSVQTLLATTSAFAIFCAGVRRPEITWFIVLIVMPIMMMVIALTSPQKGNQLDPSRRWYLFLLAKTWFCTVVLLLIVGVCLFIISYAPDRLKRAVSGDFYSHVHWLNLNVDPGFSLDNLERPTQLYDSSGYVGMIRYISVGEEWQGKSSRKVLNIQLSTNRGDLPRYWDKKQNFRIEPGGLMRLVE